MRSRVEMRARAHEVLNSYESRDIDETMLARDVLDLLDELEKSGQPEPKQAFSPGSSWKDIFVIIAMAGVILPSALLGKFFDWKLGLALWVAEGIIWSILQQKKRIMEDRNRWFAIFFVIFSTVWGPVMLAFDLLGASRFGKFLLALDSRA